MKKLLYFLLLLLILLLIYYFKYCVKQKNEIPQKFVPHQLVVNFENVPTPTQMADFVHKINLLGFRVAQSCPCAPKLLLLEDSLQRVDLNPTGDIRDGATGNGGMGTGVSRNYVFDSLRLTKFEGRRVDTSRLNKIPAVANKEVIVSIIDSGVEYENAVLKPHLLRNVPTLPFCNTTSIEGIYGINMIKALAGLTPVEPKDLNGHGTIINGIIAGNAEVDSNNLSETRVFLGDNNGVTVRQLNVSFTPRDATNGTLFHALCGIHYSLNKGAKVINASWSMLTNATNKNEVEVFATTMKALSDQDALLIASAGNDGIDFTTDSQQRLTWPAAFSKQTLTVGSTTMDFKNNVIAVGAWDMFYNTIPSFSNRGDNVVDIYAPGIRILSTRLGATSSPTQEIYTKGQGTSFAAPFVTRTAAILRGMNKTATSAIIKNTLINAVNTSSGTKLLNPQNAVTNLPPSS